jgi:hypothetical protein
MESLGFVPVKNGSRTMSEIAIQAIFLHKLITIKPVARIQMDS